MARRRQPNGTFAVVVVAVILAAAIRVLPEYERAVVFFLGRFQGVKGPGLIPVQQRLLDQQRRESVFRTLDADSNGEISMAQAGVNTELQQAFNKLDRNSDSVLERQEFTRVHVNDGSSQAQSSARTSRNADEKWQTGARSSRSGTGQSDSVPPGARLAHRDRRHYGSNACPSGPRFSRVTTSRAYGV